MKKLFKMTMTDAEGLQESFNIDALAESILAASPSIKNRLPLADIIFLQLAGEIQHQWTGSPVRRLKDYAADALYIYMESNDYRLIMMNSGGCRKFDLYGGATEEVVTAAETAEATLSVAKWVRWTV